MVHRDANKILLLVQPDGAGTGITLDALRDKLVPVGNRGRRIWRRQRLCYVGTQRQARHIART